MENFLTQNQIKHFLCDKLYYYLSEDQSIYKLKEKRYNKIKSN